MMSPIERKSRRRLLLVLAGALLLLPLAGVVGLRTYAAWRAHDQIYTLQDVPPRTVAIVFGARVMPSGRLSHMLADRVKTGAALIREGKAQVLLLTGDNGTPEYNEPEAMRRYALGLGVPDEAIVLDYAGFRTYDSCYRAGAVFGVRDAILVTQDFHLDRALLICEELGLDVVGVPADRPTGYRASSIFYSQLREFPATLVAAADLLRRPEPTFLGEPMPIAP